MNPVRGGAIARERRAIEDLREHFRTLAQEVEIWFWDNNKIGQLEPAFKEPDLLPGWIPGSAKS